MSNGIAIVVFLKNGQLNGLCNGITSHDELCKLDESLRYGETEPYRFELLYPCNLRYDRSLDLYDGIGLAKEQPTQEIWEVAFKVAKPFFMKHNLQQLQLADFRNANLTSANFKDANLRDANFRYAKIKNTNFTYANLIGADFRNANLINVNFKGANLKDTNFRDANLRGINLLYANLVGTDFQGANLIL